MKKQKRKANPDEASDRFEPGGVPIQIIDRAAVDWDNLQPGQAWWTHEADMEGVVRLTFICPGGCGDAEDAAPR